jgi:hypothetical protein
MTKKVTHFFSPPFSLLRILLISEEFVAQDFGIPTSAKTERGTDEAFFFGEMKKSKT